MIVWKLLRALGIVVAVLVLGIVCLILIADPPPLRLRDNEKVMLSVLPPPKLDGLQHPIETGLACKRKIESYTSANYGRPQITIFDWLRHQRGEPSEQDVHLYGSKPNDTWAIKLDRATKMFCYLQPSLVEAGVTDPYCGPKIIHEDANRIVAVEG
jgi:hypothetical protein